MPLGDFEREVLRLLAANRHPDSFVGGGSPRTSKDVDYFHDTIESLSASAQRDAATLRAAGYEVELGRPQDTFQRAIVHRGGRQTKVEWVFDSAFRFFPVEPDLDLGWRLNFWDVATNKVLALAGRSEVRDLVDVVYLHEQHLCLGALAWGSGGQGPWDEPRSDHPLGQTQRGVSAGGPAGGPAIGGSSRPGGSEAPLDGSVTFCPRTHCAIAAF